LVSSVPLWHLPLHTAPTASASLDSSSGPHGWASARLGVAQCSCVSWA